MTTKDEPLAVDILVAIFHCVAKVNKDVRITDDFQLAKIFDDAARKADSIFAPFKSHRQYQYSETLSKALQTLDLGGSISRENSPVQYFWITPSTRGAYGASILNQFDQNDISTIEQFAENIRDEYCAGGIA